MPDHGARWTLDRFLLELDSWIDRESPSDDLRYVVTEWVFSRREDPYAGVRREAGFDNLWFGPVPGSDDGTGRVVVCSYWVEEGSRVVRCNSMATLNLPL